MHDPQNSVGSFSANSPTSSNGFSRPVSSGVPEASTNAAAHGTRPGSYVHSATHGGHDAFLNPPAKANNKAAMIGGIAVGAGLLVVGAGLFLGGTSRSPAPATAAPANDFFTQQRQVMNEAMDMARQAQQMQREHLERMRQAMEESREDYRPSDGWASSGSDWPNSSGQ